MPLALMVLNDYNLWSSSKNAIVIEHVFTDVAVVFPKLSNWGGGGVYSYIRVLPD